MKTRLSEMSTVTYARVTGVLYLIIIVFGLFSEVFVRSGLIVRGDAAATATNILASEWLFRVGFVSDLLIFLCDVAVAMLLYVLLRSVSKTGSLISAGFRLTGTAIYGVNLLNYFAALIVLSGADYLSSLDSSQLNSIALMFLNIHRHGYDLGLVFFGLHCLFLGYLIFNSEYFPKILGIFMYAAGVGYVVGSFTLFLWPEYSGAIAPIYIAPLVGELSLCLWLLIKGVRIDKGTS
jgi:hypothetical protein